MSFDGNARSVQDSQPREILELSHGDGAVVYRVACGQRDVFYGGARFQRDSASRLELTLDRLTAEVGFTIVLSVSHALVGRWFAQLSPPNMITATVRQLQVESGAFEQIWSGEITSLNIEGNEAKLLVPSRYKRALDRTLPGPRVDARCTVVLFDTWCRADEPSHTYAAHVVNLDGRNVGVAFDVPQPAGDGWANLGKFKHLLSGELMMIKTQTGLDLVLKAPIPGMKVGDHVTVARGCDHSLETCRDAFDNVVNYVGLPVRPTRNPFFPTGTGVGDVK